MKTTTISTLACWAALSLSLPLSVAGCAYDASPGVDADPVEEADPGSSVDQGAEADAEEDVGSAAEAISTCAYKPSYTPVCNTYQCVDGFWELQPLAAGTYCTSGGKAGRCDGGDPDAGIRGQCIPNITGVLRPRYHVLSVMYAPPGSASTVDYGTGDTLGSTVSTTGTFSNNFSVTVKNKNALGPIAAGGLSVTGTATSTSTTNNSVDVKSVTQTDFILDGFHDVINHDLDRIYLWLNPQVNIVANGSDMSWTMSVVDNQLPLIQYVNVLWLRDPSTMPANVLSMLQSANIAPVDYPYILGVDPFVYGGAIDTNRFKLQTQLPYEPVAISGQNPTATKYALTKTSTSSSSTTSTTAYSVGVSVEGDVNFLSLMQTSLKVSDTMTWTHANTFSNSDASTVSATANIMQPAYGYTGPTVLKIYMDTLFNTYMFAL